MLTQDYGGRYQIIESDSTTYYTWDGVGHGSYIKTHNQTGAANVPLLNWNNEVITEEFFEW